MMFEYKVVPAPTRGQKAKGVKGTQARFALALQSVMNDLGAEGWEYQRTDTLPVEERQGLTGKSTSYQNMLVFRRALALETSTQSSPTIAALIEDQSDTAQEADVQPEITPKATTPKVAAQTDPEQTAPDAATDAAPDTPASPVVHDDAAVAAPVVPGPFAAPIAHRPNTATTADSAPDNTVAKSRVHEALKAESFAFPWDRRAKTTKTDAADTQPPAE